MSSRPLFCFFIIVLLTSCEDEVKFDATGERYFPLQVGNYWKLVPENPLGSTYDITVVDEVVVHGKNYFKLHRVITSDYDPDSDEYIYFRIDENNFVYWLSDSAANIDVNFLRLNAPNGYKWKRESGQVVTVRKQPEEINDHTINDCKSFYYDYPSSSDDEYSTTFASEIGYCRINGGWGRLSRLSFARINGVEYGFD